MTLAKPAPFALALPFALLLIGCDMPPETYTMPDAGVGGSTDDDGDAPLGPEECPWNSHYPCTCNHVGVDCDDESECLYVVGDGELGICSAVCYEPYTDCVKTAFSGESSCELEGGGASFRCALKCEQDDQCPPDQACVDVGWETLCHP